MIQYVLRVTVSYLLVFVLICDKKHLLHRFYQRTIVLASKYQILYKYCQPSIATIACLARFDSEYSVVIQKNEHQYC